MAHQVQGFCYDFSSNKMSRNKGCLVKTRRPLLSRCARIVRSDMPSAEIWVLAIPHQIIPECLCTWVCLMSRHVVSKDYSLHGGGCWQAASCLRRSWSIRGISRATRHVVNECREERRGEEKRREEKREQSTETRRVPVRWHDAIGEFPWGEIPSPSLSASRLWLPGYIEDRR